jgi:hypothetical protein
VSAAQCFLLFSFCAQQPALPVRLIDEPRSVRILQGDAQKRADLVSLDVPIENLRRRRFVRLRQIL